MTDFVGLWSSEGVSLFLKSSSSPIASTACIIVAMVNAGWSDPGLGSGEAGPADDGDWVMRVSVNGAIAVTLPARLWLLVFWCEVDSRLSRRNPTVRVGGNNDGAG